VRIGKSGWSQSYSFIHSFIHSFIRSSFITHKSITKTYNEQLDIGLKVKHEIIRIAMNIRKLTRKPIANAR